MPQKSVRRRKPREIDLRYAVITDWERFTHYIKHQNRFTLGPRWTKVLGIIERTAKNRAVVLHKGRIFSRARIGSYSFKDAPWPNKWASMWAHPLSPRHTNLAPASASKDNRANPAGISYLYLADNDLTAIMEARGGIKSLVTVAHYRLNKTLKILDLTAEFRKKPAPEKGFGSYENELWFGINRAFSHPWENIPSDYYATQYIAEVFKREGWDGLKYQSSQNPKGYNLVIFRKQCADPIKSGLYKVKGVSLTKELVGRWQTPAEMKQRPTVYF